MRHVATLKYDQQLVSRAVAELWRFDTFWLFLFSKAHYATIPLEGMSAEMQSYVVERVRDAGGSVH